MGRRRVLDANNLANADQTDTLAMIDTSGRSLGNGQSAAQPAGAGGHVPKTEPQVSLYRILLDVEEYHGFNRLLLFCLYFITAVCLLYTQWGGLTSNAPAFKTSVAEGFKSVLCNPEGPGPAALTGTQALTIDQVNDIPFALDYMIWYMQCAKNTTAILDLPDKTTLWAGEFARITFIQLKMHVDTSCDTRDSMIKDSKYMECNRNSTSNDPKLSPMWEASPWPKEKYSKVAILKVPDATLEDLQEKLDTLNARDRNYIDRYALGLKLQMVAFDRLGQDAAYFSFEVRFADGDRKTVRQIASSTISPPFSKQHFIWGGLFLLGTLIFTSNEIKVLRLTYLQRGSLVPYLYCWWNWITVLSGLANWAWAIVYVIVLAKVLDIKQTVKGNEGIAKFKQQPNWRQWPADAGDFNELERGADFFTGFLYGGLLVLLLLGIRICRFMRIHLGMKALYLVFVDVARHIVDFAVFATYIMVVLGVLCFGFFQISGGNPKFVEFPNGLSAMARLAFGYIEWDDFYNEATGTNVDWNWTRSGLFWLSVVCLGVFFTNMLIAIFNDAYGRAMSRAIKVEHSFIVLMLLRIVYMLYYLTWMLFKHILLGKYRQAAKTTKAYGLYRAKQGFWSVFMGRRLTCYMEFIPRAKDLYDSTSPQEANQEIFVKHSWVSKWARWSLAGCIEMDAMFGLFLDYAELKVPKRDAGAWVKLRAAHDLPQTQGDGKVHAYTSQAAMDMSAWLDEDDLRQVIEDVLTMRARLDQVNKSSCCGLWYILCWNPMRWFRQADKELLLEALLDVYDGVPRPIVDADDDGLDDTEAYNQLSGVLLSAATQSPRTTLQPSAPGIWPPTPRATVAAPGPGAVPAAASAASSQDVQQLQQQMQTLTSQMEVLQRLLMAQQQQQRLLQ